MKKRVLSLILALSFILGICLIPKNDSEAASASTTKSTTFTCYYIQLSQYIKLTKSSSNTTNTPQKIITNYGKSITGCKWAKNSSGEWYVAKNGQPFTNDRKCYMICVNGSVYGCFNSFLAKNCLYEGSANIVLFNASTQKLLVNGWKQVKDKWFRTNSYGQIVTGWKKISNKWYYLDPNQSITPDKGVKLYGVCLMNTSKKIGNKVYKFDKNGVCLNP